MGNLHGGQLLAKQLASHGIDTVFGVVAGPMLEAFSALVAEGIRVVGCRHEEQAGFMAQAWGYVMRKPGVVMVGSGPGMANTIPSLYVAQESGLPLVVLGGSAPGRTRGLGGFQELDQVGLAGPICTWAAQVDSAGRIPEYVHLALGRALAGRPGAVYLDFPAELIRETVPESEAQWRHPPAAIYAPHPDPHGVEAIAAMLAEAERPLLLIGKGAAWADTADPLRRLVDLGIPFVPSPMGRGTVPDDHPLCAGAARSFALHSADAVLMVGGRFNWIFQHGRFGRGEPGRRPRIAQIDVVAEEFHSAADVEVGLVSDCAAAVAALHTALDRRPLRSRDSRWLQELRQRCHENRAALEERTVPDTVPMSHFRLCREIRDVLERDATVVVDGEMIMSVARMVIPTFLPRHRLNSGTTGCMGTGVPYAIGAKLARPDRQVVAILGDYAFGASAMEVETAARVGAAVVFVVANNAGIVGHLLQRRMFDAAAPAVAALLPARYEQVAEAVGGYYEHVETPHQLGPALRRALAAGTVAVVNVAVDPNERVHKRRGYMMLE